MIEIYLLVIFMREMLIYLIPIIYYLSQILQNFQISWANKF
jgi:hypothetical protein